MTDCNPGGLAFRKLDAKDFDDAYGLLVAVTDWLNSRGIRQWRSPIPRHIYRARHDRGENHGLFVDGKLAAVLSLSVVIPERWHRFVPEGSYRWLATMATARNVHGRRVGEVALDVAEKWAAAEGIEWMYLDCSEGNGFLPRYYGNAGYERLETLELHSGTTMCLFRKQL